MCFPQLIQPLFGSLEHHSSQSKLLPLNRQTYAELLIIFALRLRSAALDWSLCLGLCVMASHTVFDYSFTVIKVYLTLGKSYLSVVVVR